MPTYALLGATGSTGSAILRSLIVQPPQDLTVNIFVRSKSKLEKSFPDLESSPAFKANIIEGVPSDATALQQCVKDVDVIFGCIGTNIGTPGMSLIYDTITSVIDALKTHRKTRGASYKPPAVIQLRSASLNPYYKAKLPYLAQVMAPFCFGYIYADLGRACELLASSPELLRYILIDPPSIHDADGTTPTGYRLILEEKQEPALSYSDLGAAFCEVAQRRGEFVGKAVGVTATGKVNETWGVLMGYMATGAKARLWG